ncbi:MAG: AMP-binding protein [Oxalicibacterium faecigallinarum]|uniref:AMP-binding protein n=1 Tax=Oxalicibacterium faecigallinarum TaxID=573741 RepID=UPI00280956FE|nr:AMP-binding protein [Oxalicibacterium faecigallinarum]MDQ7968532.1 AMP-binding protein [Oxalicibacterium faecigallinarum]
MRHADRPDGAPPASLRPFVPLLPHTDPSRIVAWRDTHAVTAAQFLSDVRQLIPQLPASTHVLNDCHDRYRFLVALCAIMVAGKINLLPSTRTAETIRQLQGFAPDASCLTDQANCTIALPQTAFPTLRPEENITFALPQLADDQVVAYVFTSGSTGLPVAHRKTWGALVRNVQAEAQQLGLLNASGCTIVGTVPPQHMYGFESTVLMPLINGFAMASAPWFYPADICRTLEQVPAPRVLVTTPVHLRQLISMQTALPTTSLIVSATAPLAPQLAAQSEQAFKAPLCEIYGSTETGQIATRRPTVSQEWNLFPNIQMQRHPDDASDERMWISGGHVEVPMPMNDAIELKEAGRFLMHGRMADMINIAGKRSSLAYLNHHLNAIPGVEDGAFYMPPEKTSGEVTRLQAFVVAPLVETETILSVLREKIDPAFMPRPLLKVPQLPRNATGKLPHAALAELAATFATNKTDTH